MYAADAVRPARARIPTAITNRISFDESKLRAEIHPARPRRDTSRRSPPWRCVAKAPHLRPRGSALLTVDPTARRLLACGKGAGGEVDDGVRAGRLRLPRGHAP